MLIPADAHSQTAAIIAAASASTVGRPISRGETRSVNAPTPSRANVFVRLSTTTPVPARSSR